MTHHLSLSFINAHVLVLLALIVSPCAVCWFCDVKWARPFMAVGFSIAAALIVVGVPAWQDALASLISTQRSLAILVVVALLSGTWFLIHVCSIAPSWMRRRPAIGPQSAKKVKYHHIWTHVSGVLAGTAVMLLVADGVNFLRAAGNAPGGAAGAFSTTMRRVSSGKAAAAVHASHGLSPGVLVGAVIAVLALAVFLARRHPAVPSKPKAKAAAVRGPARPAPAIPTGPAPAAIDRRAH